MNLPPLEMRTLSPEFWQGLRNIRLDMLTVNPGAYYDSYENCSKYDMAAWCSLFSANTYIGMLTNDLVVGIVGTHPDAKRSGTVVIHSMYVRPDYRRQSIGTKLLVASLYAASSSFDIAKLYVATEQEEAIALYTKNGFERKRVVEGVYGDGKMHHAFVMERPI